MSVLELGVHPFLLNAAYAQRLPSTDAICPGASVVLDGKPAAFLGRRWGRAAFQMTDSDVLEISAGCCRVQVAVCTKPPTSDDDGAGESTTGRCRAAGWSARMRSARGSADERPTATSRSQACHSPSC